MHPIEWRSRYMYHVKIATIRDCTAFHSFPLLLCTISPSLLFWSYCYTRTPYYNTSHSSVTLNPAPQMQSSHGPIPSWHSLGFRWRAWFKFYRIFLESSLLATLDEQLSIPELHTRRNSSVWLSSSRMMSLLSSPRPLRPMSTTPTGLFS